MYTSTVTITFSDMTGSQEPDVIEDFACGTSDHYIVTALASMTKLDVQHWKQHTKLYKALANERRLLLLEFLLKQDRAEQWSLFDIANRLKINHKLVSKHFQQLDRANLVERARRGQSVGYQITKLGKFILTQSLSI